jgi:hypothetical protein
MLRCAAATANSFGRVEKKAMTQSNLGTTLQSFGERESGTTKLEEAVAAFSEALKERDRERVPLQWAYSFGKQGVALMLLAERRKDAALGESALTQITVALQTVREGGDDSTAAYYERQLSKARSIVARLRGQ